MTESTKTDTAAKAVSSKVDRPEHDRVVMASRNPDGSIKDFDPEFIGPKDDVARAAEKQLSQIAVSAVDQEKRPIAGVDTEGSSEPDKAVAELKKAHDQAADAASRAARAEVDKLHDGDSD